jgi:gliding motility-associated-like protein
MKLRLLFISSFIVLIGSLSLAQTPKTNRGKDFWFGFTPTSDLATADYVVYITAPVNTSGTISIPGATWSNPFTVAANVTTRIVLPAADVIQSAGFGSPISQAVHVVSNDNVSVFSAIETSERSDNTCVYPITALGNDYFVMDYTPNGPSGNSSYSASSFIVVAQDCPDTVQITPVHSLTLSGTHPANVPFTEVLQPGDVFLVQCDSDLTGSEVKSLNHSQTAVIAGAWWNSVYCNGTANPFYEELFPINTWGQGYVFLPTPHAEDQCRVLSEQNGTTINFVTNAGTNSITLNAGKYYDTSVNYSTPIYISATNPISVGRFMRTGDCNDYYGITPGSRGDPAEIIESAVEQMHLDSITFYVSTTPDMDSNYISIVTRTPDINTVMLDGTNIGSSFTALAANNAYSYTSIKMAAGTHNLLTTGQGVLAYYTGMGDVDGEGCNTGVYLRNIIPIITNSTPAGCSNNGTATASAIGIPPFTYLWSNGQTTQTATGLSGGTYTVTVSDKDCVPHSDTATVTITTNLGAGFAVLDTTNPSCSSAGSAKVTTSSNTYTYTYSWSNGETTSAVTGLSAGTYYVIIDSSGCKDSLSFVLVGHLPNFTVTVTPQKDTICNGDSVRLIASGATTYTWTPVTGLSCNTCPNPIATPVTTTTYTVTGDSSGCNHQASANVYICSVDSSMTIYIPDAFSPNGDGRNDLFIVQGTHIASFSMYIFDRWGTFVYGTSDISQGWDGTSRGIKCEQDTYVYQIIVYDNDGARHSYIGAVSLLR